MEIPNESKGTAPSLRERRRAQTREDLISAVLEVIESLSFEQLTIERISTAAGVSRGTVYSHFSGGLTELVEAAYARIGRMIVARTIAEIDRVDRWTDELTAHARAMFDFAASSGSGHFYNVSGPAFIAAAESREAKQARAQTNTTSGPRGIGSGTSRTMITNTLARAQAAGQLRGSVVPESVATLLVGAIREAAIAIANGEAEPSEQLGAFASLISGLESPA